MVHHMELIDVQTHDGQLHDGTFQVRCDENPLCPWQEVGTACTLEK